MDISNLSNIGNKLNKAEESSKGERTSDTSDKSPADSTADKVSISDYKFRNNDQLFAKLELEKLNESSSGQLQEMKAQISEYNEASQSSSEDAADTEMGQKLNDPSVWGDIANKILQ